MYRSIVLLALLLFVGCQGDQSYPAPPLPSIDEYEASYGTTELDVDVVALDGSHTNLSSLEGKTVLLNFWSMTCGPCLFELPSLYEQAETLAAEENVAVVLLATNELSEILPYVEDNPSDDVHVFAWTEELPDELMPYGMPTSFIIDSNRNIRYRHVGAADWADKSVSKYLAELSRATI